MKIENLSKDPICVGHAHVYRDPEPFTWSVVIVHDKHCPPWCK